MRYGVIIGWIGTLFWVTGALVYVLQEAPIIHVALRLVAACGCLCSALYFQRKMRING